MAHKSVASSWDREKFLKFLVTRHDISDRVARNYLSRCRRLEAVLNIDLVNETSSVEAYLNLVEKIASYAENHFHTSSEVTVFNGTLRLAAKKFALFAHGSKVKLPRIYRRINLIN
jgi:hypothetical protein